VDVWHEVHDGQTRYQEEILDLAVGVGYTVMHALRLVDRLRQGEPDLVALERAHFAEFAQSQGRSLAAANVLFDSFLRGGVPRASAVYNAMLAYRSAYLKAHHPAAWLETILSWRQGLSMDHPLMQEFARLGVEKQAMKDRLQGENRSRDEQRHSRRGNKEQA
jgi:DNA polymerase III alpha subunit